MAFNLASFKKDPVTYLRQQRFITPGNRSSGETDVTGRRTVDGFELCTVNVLSSAGFGVAENSKGNCFDVALGGSTFTGYWLPWNDDKAFQMTVGDRYEVFITAKINSCGIIIGGPEGSPVVIHANAMARISDPPSTFGLAPNLAASISREHQSNVNNEYKLAYGNLAAKLISDGVFGGGKPNVFVLDPEYYLSAKSGSAGVFGVRNGGTWKFYVNIHCTGNIGKTIEIWPNSPVTLPVL